MILLLTAMQPTLVFHYCGNNLHSVDIGSDHSKHACNGKCCSDYKVTLATDDFQVSQETTEIPPLVSHPVLFVLSGNLFLGTLPGIPSILQFLFPPGGLATYSADLLTLICIFRI
ncbi:hypothetical protein FACS189423_06020 [Bacteroidia bacterium]|nr:hypothetical protein FACS189423_06020 [Bacteroidia bacterium]